MMDKAKRRGVGLMCWGGRVGDFGGVLNPIKCG